MVNFGFPRPSWIRETLEDHAETKAGSFTKKGWEVKGALMTSGPSHNSRPCSEPFMLHDTPRFRWSTCEVSRLRLRRGCVFKVWNQTPAWTTGTFLRLGPLCVFPWLGAMRSLSAVSVRVPVSAWTFGLYEVRELMVLASSRIKFQSNTSLGLVGRTRFRIAVPKPHPRWKSDRVKLRRGQ